MNDLTRRLWPWIGLIALLLVAFLAYRPGLSGGFLFDDFVNLDAIGATGPIDNWPAFWRFLTSGTADPIGRPLALLTFLADARDWPAEPGAFLRSNLALHLLNGALLFSLLRKLGRYLTPDDAQQDATALLASGLWLLHPLFVSTTLYAVQREAMLPATFTLLGLLAYGHGREQFRRSAGESGLIWMIAGIGLGTTLATLSKANGILLPMLAWVLESTVWSSTDTVTTAGAARAKLRRSKWILLILPSLCVFAYLATNLPRLNAVLGSRPWTIGQRLITEPRVLLDYLQLLFVPRAVSSGIYNDGYSFSQDLFHPATTLPALLLVVGLAYAAIRGRRRTPRFSAAILFFMAGHLLESTLIPLELYFEHRNYLPTMLLFWPISQLIISWKARKSLRVLVAVVLLALFANTTNNRASLWGQPGQLAALWALQNPDSSRAQATAAMALTAAGQPQRAAERLGTRWKEKPGDLQLGLNYIDASCQWRGVTSSDKQALTHTFLVTRVGELLMYQWLGRAMDVAAAQQCPGLELNDVQEWIAALDANPSIGKSASRDQTIEPLLAQMAIKQQRPEASLRHFNQALLAFPTPDSAARNVAYLASAGYFQQAIAHLDYFETIKPSISSPVFGMPWLHRLVLERQGYWPREMAILRKKLADETAAQPAHDVDPPGQSP